MKVACSLLLACGISANAVARDWPQHQAVPLKRGANHADIFSLPLVERFSVDLSAVGQATAFNLGSAVTCGATILVATNEGVLVALDRKQQTELWRHVFGAPIRGAPAVAGNTAACASMDGWLVALDINGNGTEVWSYFAGSPLSSSPTVARVAAEDRVFVGSADGVLHCLRAGDGSLIWKAPASAAIWGSPTVREDIGRVYVASYDGKLYAFNAVDGQSVWVTDPDAIPLGPMRAAVPVLGSRLYVATITNGLHALEDTGSGVEERWSITWTGGHAASPAVVPSQGLASATIYVANDAGELRAVEDRGVAGSVRWTMGAGGRTDGAVAFAGNLVFVGSEGKTVRAYRAGTGAEAWSVSTTEAVDSSPAIAGGRVLVTDALGVLHVYGNALDPPESLSAIGGDAGQIALHWNPVLLPPMGTPAQGYLVYRSPQPDGVLEEISFVSGTSSVYVDEGLTESGMYYYAVTSVHDVSGDPGLEESTYSDRAHAFVEAGSPEIAGLSALAGDGLVRLSWRVEGCIGAVRWVNLYRREDGGEFLLTRTLSGVDLTFTDIRVENRIPYGYALSVVDVWGRESPLSVEVPATPFTYGWPMFQRDMLHEGYDPEQKLSLPLGRSWMTSLGGILSGYQCAIVVSGTLYATSANGVVRACNAATGEVLWEKTGFGWTISTPAYHNGRLYITYSDGLAVLHADSGEVDWSLPVSEVGFGQESSPIIYRGVLYAGQIYANKFQLVAVDIESRARLWAHGPLGIFKSSPVAAEGLVYLMDSSLVRALDATTGAFKWERSIGTVSTTGTISLSVCPPVLLVLPENGWLYGLDAEQGGRLWQAYVRGKYTSPVVAGSTVFVSSYYGNNVLALDAMSGSYWWIAETFSATMTGIRQSGPVVAGDQVHVFTSDGLLYTLARGTGARLDVADLGVRRQADHLSVGSGHLYVPFLATGDIVAATSVSPAPLGLSAVYKDRVVVLTWEPVQPNVSPISGYEVFRSTAPGVEGEVWLSSVPGAGASRYVDSTFAPGGTYYYRVRAVDVRGGAGRFSGQESATTTSAVISPFVEPGDGLVRLNWQLVGTPGDCVHLKLYRREDGAADMVFVRDLPRTGSYVDIRVENGVPYGYALSAVDVLGRESLLSVEATATPFTCGWPMLQRDARHGGYDPEQELGLPLRKLWTTTLGGTLGEHQGAVVVSGTLYATSPNGVVRACNAVTGALLWEKTGFGGTLSTPAYHNGRLYVTHGGGLAVLRADTGVLDWSLPVADVGAGQESSPVIYKGVLYAGQLLNGKFQLVAVDIETRSRKWAHEEMGILKYSPVAASGAVYVVDASGYIRARDWATGALKWSWLYGWYGAVSLAVCPPVLLVNGEDGYIQGLDIQTGYPKWQKYVQGGHTYPVVAGTTLFVSSRCGNDVLAMDVEDGSYLWIARTYSETVTGVCQSSPVVVGGQVHLYTTDGLLYTLDAADGATLDVANLRVGLSIADLAAASGRLYIPVGTTGKIIAVGPVLPAPSGLVASTDAESVYLSWNPVPSGVPAVASYRVYRSNVAGEKGVVVGTVAWPTTSYIDILVPRPPVFYQVCAVDTDGFEGRLSAQIMVQLPVGITASIVSPTLGEDFCTPTNVQVTGRADATYFSRYRLLIDNVQVYEGSTPVVSGVLGSVPIYAGGLTSRRITLIVEDTTGASKSVDVSVDARLESDIVADVFTNDGAMIYVGGTYSFIYNIYGLAYVNPPSVFDHYTLDLVDMKTGQVNPIKSSSQEVRPDPRGFPTVLGTAVILPSMFGSYRIDLQVYSKCEGHVAKDDPIVKVAKAITVVTPPPPPKPGKPPLPGKPVWTPKPGISRKFSTRGRDPGEHRLPIDVAVDQEDYLWVVDTQNRRLQKYTAEGDLLFEFGEKRTGEVAWVAFGEPVAAAVDGANNLLVLDRADGTITRWNEHGEFMAHVVGGGSQVSPFLHPEGLAVDGQGRIYVADSINNRIQVLSSDGTLLFPFGSEGAGPGQFNRPTGVSVDPNTGSIIVTDSLNNRIQVFDSTGVFIYSQGTHGSGVMEYHHPYEAVAARSFSLFVSDRKNDRFAWYPLGDPEATPFMLFPPPDMGFRVFNKPHGIALDRAEEWVYIADTYNNSIVGIRVGESEDTVLPRALITSPTDGGTVEGVVDVVGIAADANFAQYMLECASLESPEVFHLIAMSEKPVWNGSLGLWDTANLVSGSYTLRLRVKDDSGNESEARVQVTVDALEYKLIVNLSALPTTFERYSGGTAVSYTLASEANVKAVIYDQQTHGIVVELEPGSGVRAMVSPTTGTLAWDGRDSRGQAVPAGDYLAVLLARDEVLTDRALIGLKVEPSMLDRPAGGGGYLPGRGGGAAPALVSAPGQAAAEGGATGGASGAGSGGSGGAADAGKGNNGVRDHGAGEGRDGHGQGRGQGTGPNR